MPNFESQTVPENARKLINRFEDERIDSGEDFSQLYSEYNHDMARTEQIGAIYENENPEMQFGKVAEALVFSELKKNAISEYLQFRPTSHYDDYFHGADLLVEPLNAPLQSLAAIDITVNQEDIKGSQRSAGQYAEVRPVGLEKKLLRARAYTDRLAGLDSSHARELSAWIGSGGLHERRETRNQQYFDEVERLFLMKYYKAPDTAAEPNKPGFVIGGPQAVISIDSLFINQALQGNKAAAKTIGDLALLEFIYCVQAEDAYLKEIVKNKKERNIFFDTHFSKVRSWAHVFERPEIGGVVEDVLVSNKQNREFREQLDYYGKTFSKINQNRR